MFVFCSLPATKCVVQFTFCVFVALSVPCRILESPRTTLAHNLPVARTVQGNALTHTWSKSKTLERTQHTVLPVHASNNKTGVQARAPYLRRNAGTAGQGCVFPCVCGCSPHCFGCCGACGEFPTPFVRSA